MTAQNDPERLWIAVPVELRLRLTQAAREFRRAPTLTEDRLWQALRGKHLGVRFRRQQPIGPFIVDFFCSSARLIVEVDGAVHDDQVEQDRVREDLLRACGYRVLRVTAEHVDLDLDGVVDRIREALPLTPGPSPPRGEGSSMMGDRGENEHSGS